MLVLSRKSQEAVVVSGASGNEQVLSAEKDDESLQCLDESIGRRVATPGGGNSLSARC
jgi:hypothetical protein